MNDPDENGGEPLLSYPALPKKLANTTREQEGSRNKQQRKVKHL